MPNHIAPINAPTWTQWLIALAACVALLRPAAAQPMGDTVATSASANVTQVTPGGDFALAVVFDHQPGWHTHTNNPVIPKAWGDFPAVPTQVTLHSAPGALVGPTQWPRATSIAIDLAGTGTPEKYAVFEGRAITLIPMKAAPDATGEIKVKIKTFYQACDDTTCEMPTGSTLDITIPVGSTTTPAANLADFKSLGSAVFADASAFKPASASAPSPAASPTGAHPGNAQPASNFFGIPLPQGGGAIAVIVLFLLAALGGLILNLTPCVLPVIPLKIMALSQHAGSHGRTLYLGLCMAAGVVAFWVGIGVPVIVWSSFGDPSTIFAVWWVTFGLGVVIAVLAVGLMGMFSLSLPQSVASLNPRADTAHGSFLFGVMTAVLGLPCFGFVAGALLAAAATLPKLVTLVVFLGLGVGMALPYLVLAMKPAWIDKIPRTGPASDLVKQVMGLLLLAAGLYFVGSGLVGLVAEKPYMARLLHWWAAAVCAVIASAWMVWRTFQITRSPGRRAAFTLLAVFIAGVGVWFVNDLTQAARASRWVPFTPAAFEQARAQNKVVVVDFTAEWCINCKGLKARVLSKSPATDEFVKDDVVQMVVDYTGPNPDGEAFQKSLNRKGIPLLAIFGPGTTDPWLANAYTGPQVVEAVTNARGKQAASTK